MSAEVSRFDGLWLPRIGPAATRRLRVFGYWTLVVGPVDLALALICSFAFGAGTARGIAVGVAVAVVALVLVWGWIRNMMLVATELSAWLGIPARWWEMPRMQTAQFDRWVASRRFPVAESDAGH